MIKRENFNEEEYRKGNPDIIDLIGATEFPTGYDHYMKVGYREGRWCPRLVKKNTEVLVSIIMPNYNKENYLPHAIESVLNQDYQNLELIVVDDVSTDNSVAIIRSYCSLDSRLKLIQHRGNSGGCAAPRNTGLAEATGEVVCFLDSDDVLFNGCLASRIDSYLMFARNNETVIGVFSGTQTISEDFTAFPYVREEDRNNVKDFISTAGDCPFNSNQPMLKRKELTKFGGFDESLSQAEDWHLWLRIMRHGFCFKSTGYDGVGYRNCRVSMVRENSLQHVANGSALIESAHRALDDDEVVPGTPFVFRKPWIEYKKQILQGNRVFSFLAMTVEDHNYGDVIENYIPDIDGIGPFIKPLDSLIKGYKRKTANATNSDASVMRLISQEVVKKLSQSFQKEDKQSNVVNSEIGKNKFLRYGVINNVDVLLFPHSAYHVLELSYVAKELNKLGVSTLFINSEVPYRKQGVKEKLVELDLPYINYGNLNLYSVSPKAVVCMCDWDIVVKKIFLNMHDRGVKTIGIVEGVQDFLDADTGRPRNAYRTVEHLFIPGNFDLKYFPDQSNIYLSGISRIDALLNETLQKQPSFDVLINVNFTYNVLEDKRDRWLKDIVETTENLSLEYRITQHHADQANLNDYKVSNEPLYDLLKDTKVLVTRFSTVVLEALALKVPVVYYNPIIEKVDKFNDPLGAYEYVCELDQLSVAISKSIDKGWDFYEEAAENFLDLHCNTSKKESTAIIVARKIKEIAHDI